MVFYVRLWFRANEQATGQVIAKTPAAAAGSATTQDSCPGSELLLRAGTVPGAGLQLDRISVEYLYVLHQQLQRVKINPGLCLSVEDTAAVNREQAPKRRQT